MLLKAKTREITGKKVATLREQGLIPAVLYGWGEKSPIVLSIDKKEFQKVWDEAGESSIIELDVDGNKKDVLIYEVANDPLRGDPIHVDFYAARMDKPIEAYVPIVFEGESPAVKSKGGILVKVMHEILVEALPKQLPPEIIVNISGLNEFDDKIMISDIKLLEGVKIKAHPEEVVVLVERPKAEEEETVERSLEDIEVEKKGKEESSEESTAEGETETKAE